MPDAVTPARLEADLMGKVLALATDPKDALARALASLGRAMKARDEGRRSAELAPHIARTTAKTGGKQYFRGQL